MITMSYVLRVDINNGDNVSESTTVVTYIVGKLTQYR